MCSTNLLSFESFHTGNWIEKFKHSEELSYWIQCLFITLFHNQYFNQNINIKHYKIITSPSSQVNKLTINLSLSSPTNSYFHFHSALLLLYSLQHYGTLQYILPSLWGCLLFQGLCARCKCLWHPAEGSLMLGELLTHAVQDGAGSVHTLHLALQSSSDGLTGGQGLVAAPTHLLQLLGPAL